MGKKYIIELPENTHWIQWLMEGIKDHHPYMDFKSVEDLTPYTEPDLDAIRKEAYQRGHKDGYNKHDTERIRKRGYDKGLDDIGNALRLLLFQYSNYTLQTIFGYNTARAVVEHFEGSEIVARIRCYEGGVKQDVETIRKEAYYKGYEAGAESRAIAIADDKAHEAYQKGLSDAKEGKATCQYCEYQYLDDTEEPCKKCCNAYMNKYKPRHEEQIQVGDEVIAGEGKAVVIGVGPVHLEYIYADGSTGYDKVENVTKTGRHFPEIAEVLQKIGG